jgi:MFS transporter, MHS family, shikimate and dehydroshikimate transport protein
MNTARPAFHFDGRENQTSPMTRIVVSSVLGSAVEWYDFIIYGTASALVFNTLFFPFSDPAIGTIAAFGSYGVGFLARPLGAAIFGHFGDRVGRKAMLAMTIIIMGIGTFFIGLLPTYEQIGIAAPLLLVFVRLLQGIGLGGEWGGAVLMVVENSSPKTRGFLSSLVQIGYPIGSLTAIAVFALVSRASNAHFSDGYWRIAFLLSLLLTGLGLYIRAHLEETPAFRAIKAKQSVAESPLTEILTTHRRDFFMAIGLKLSEISYAAICNVFAISYVTDKLGLSRSVILNAILLAAAISLFAIPIFGWLSDRIGRKSMFYGSCLFAACFAFPMFWLLDTKDPLTITLTVVAALVFGNMIGFGVGASWYPELFATRLRYSGASLGFQIGAALGGGFTPALAAMLLTWTDGKTWPISLYLIALATVTFVVAWIAPETSRTQLKEG